MAIIVILCGAPHLYKKDMNNSGLYIINDFRDIEILEVKGEDMKSIKKKAIDEGIKRGIDKRQKR